MGLSSLLGFATLMVVSYSGYWGSDLYCVGRTVPKVGAVDGSTSQEKRMRGFYAVQMMTWAVTTGSVEIVVEMMECCVSSWEPLPKYDLATRSRHSTKRLFIHS